MITGSRIIDRPVDEVLDRIRLAMSAGNFEIIRSSPYSIIFRHGTLLTHSAPLLPKRGIIELVEHGGMTEASFSVEPCGFAAFWLPLFGILFCWLIYPPIVAYRALVHHPRRLMENLLEGI